MKIDLFALPGLFRATAIALLACSVLAKPAAATEHPSVKREIDLPPSADLSYAVKAQKHGFSLEGDALLKWRATDSTYSIAMETRAMLLGKIIESKSEGAIDAYGLAPMDFTEKRIRKEPTTTTFNRSNKLISFTQSSETYPIKGGEQDRNSILWQLIGVARGKPDAFKVGTEWAFFVAGQRDAEPWRFKVINQEKSPSAFGDISVLHIQRVPPPDARGKQLDIWLAPSLDWYPFRLHFTDPDGNTTDQTLVNIDKK